jgi:hypothetical protein
MVALYVAFLVLGLNSAVIGQAIYTSPGNSNVIVAAPHAQSDVGSGDIVEIIGKRTGFSTLTVNNGRSMKTRFNVNRPTIGGGLRCSAEPRTEAAQAVYEDYRAKVIAINPQPALYVEIHGEQGRDASIQVATKGISVDEAARLKKVFEQVQDKALANSNTARANFLIEPVDKLTLTASCAKKIGIFREFTKVLHMELSEVIRKSSAWEIYSTILADFLTVAFKPGKTDQSDGLTQNNK